MKKHLRRSFLVLVSLLLLATAAFAGDRINPVIDPADGYYCVREITGGCDENGNLIPSDHNFATTYQYEFSADGTVKKRTESEPVGDDITRDIVMAYTYDEQGRCTKESESCPEAGWEYVSEYTYDAENQIRSHRWTYIINGVVDYDVLSEYTYDAHGNVLTVKSQYLNFEDDPEISTYEYTYDDAGRMTSMKEILGGGYEYTTTYDYQETDEGLVVTEERIGGTTVYIYDLEGRLTKFSYKCYTYDSATDTCSDEVNQTIDVAYFYDEYGNCIKEIYDFWYLGDEPFQYVTCYEFETYAELTGVVENPFTDVRTNKFYYEPVLWAVEKGITQGDGSSNTFNPDGECTRGQVVTFLWRAAGEPEPNTTEHSFTDVKEGKYYYKAMLWAVEKGITNGLTATTFGPDEKCSRAEFVTFLWRAEQKPAAQGSTSFTDTEANRFYTDAVVWAAENNITNGDGSDTIFNPTGECSRGQVVTFLYRAYH